MVGFVRDADALPVQQQADPLVWLVNRLHRDDQDELVMEGIFSNYNDDIVLEADQNTLVGRTDPARGPAQRIIVESPLTLKDGILSGTPGGAQGPQGPMGPQGPQGIARPEG